MDILTCCQTQDAREERTVREPRQRSLLRTLSLKTTLSNINARLLLYRETPPVAGSPGVASQWSWQLPSPLLEDTHREGW